MSPLVVEWIVSPHYSSTMRFLILIQFHVLHRVIL